MLKTNWELDQKKFKHLGINHYDLPTNMYDWLKIKSFEAKDKGYDARNRLIGHIQNEYFIRANGDIDDLGVDNDQTYLELEKWLSTRSFEKPANMFHDQHYILKNNHTLSINSLWVNFQKKYEFNPPHIHGGIFSFIIFINVPYDLKDEMKYFSVGKNGLATHSSRLYFLTISNLNHHMNGIELVTLDVDKSYEGKILIFPSILTHGVQPFYTSDDYRVTISGNLVFDV